MTCPIWLILDRDGKVVDTFLSRDDVEPINLAYLEAQGCRLVEGRLEW